MWTIALSLGVIGLAFILLLLAMSFSKEKFGIKTVFLGLALAVTPIIAQICSLLVDNYATGDLKTKLSLMTLSLIIITIIVFVVFMIYIFITLLRNILQSVNPKKKGMDNEE